MEKKNRYHLEFLRHRLQLRLNRITSLILEVQSCCNKEPMPTNNIREFLQGKSLLTSTNEEKERNLYRVLLKSRSGEPCYESNPQELLNAVSKLGPRQVCQYQFKTNDIVWICRECQKVGSFLS